MSNTKRINDVIMDLTEEMKTKMDPEDFYGSLMTLSIRAMLYAEPKGSGDTWRILKISAALAKEMHEKNE